MIKRFIILWLVVCILTVLSVIGYVGYMEGTDQELFLPFYLLSYLTLSPDRLLEKLTGYTMLRDFPVFAVLLNITLVTTYLFTLWVLLRRRKDSVKELKDS